MSRWSVVLRRGIGHLYQNLTRFSPERILRWPDSDGRDMKFGVGQAVRRTEDVRFVTGRGRYTDDLHFPEQTFACFSRSPHAHARILGIDVEAAKAAPGVVCVLTHVNVEAFGAKPMPCLAPLSSRDGSPPKASPKPLPAAPTHMRAFWVSMWKRRRQRRVSFACSRM